MSEKLTFSAGFFLLRMNDAVICFHCFASIFMITNVLVTSNAKQRIPA